MPIPDVINFGVDPGEHNIGARLRGITSWFTLQILKQVSCSKRASIGMPSALML